MLEGMNDGQHSYVLQTQLDFGLEKAPWGFHPLLEWAWKSAEILVSTCHIGNRCPYFSAMLPEQVNESL